ncbi:hypothetical protein LAD54_27535 [Klebsiella pneumoniae]|nr:hypothetical protein [Klebsiella pneumoniae]
MVLQQFTTQFSALVGLTLALRAGGFDLSTTLYQPQVFTAFNYLSRNCQFVSNKSLSYPADLKIGLFLTTVINYSIFLRNVFNPPASCISPCYVVFLFFFD